MTARGPFGIRTWFYNRRGTRGWERYLPEGYPAFPTPERQAAFTALNTLALQKRAITSGTIRGVWTQPTPPDATTLSKLQTDLAAAANCTNETQFAPPTYASAPAGRHCRGRLDTDGQRGPQRGIDAEQVIDHFGDVDTMRKGLFESESLSLPAIASDLKLNGAAGNTTTFDFQSFFAGTAGIAASIAGLAPGGAELSAGLWIASEMISMLPSASATATSTFQGTYDTLLTKLTTAQEEMAVALTSQRQQVLGDQGLLGLVGQLRSTGTWKPDLDGMQSASREAFALETYQALLPTMYNRYVVTNCTDVFYLSGDETDCTLPSGRFVTGGGTNRTWLGPPAADPCFSTNTVTDCEYQQNPGTMPDGIANVVWGAVSPTCNYKPPNKNTLWTYGCSLGVPYAQGILADGGGWSFTTESGDPEVVLEAGATRALGATTGTRSRRRAHRLERAAAQAEARVRAPRGRSSLRCGSPAGCRSPAGCGCAGCASWSTECCSSTVVTRSRPLRLGPPAAAVRAPGTSGPGCYHPAARRAACAPAVAAPRRTRPRAAGPDHPPGPGPATSAPSARCSLPASAAPAGRWSSRRACACATAACAGGSPCASPGAACATARASSSGSDP